MEGGCSCGSGIGFLKASQGMDQSREQADVKRYGQMEGSKVSILQNGGIQVD